MKIKIETAVKSNKGLIVFPLFQENLKKLPKNCSEKVKKFVKTQVKAKDFEGKDSEHLFTYIDDQKTLVLGAGETKKFSTKLARELGAKIGKSVKGYKVTELTVVLHDDFECFEQEIIEGILMTQYVFDTFKTSDKKNKKKELEKINLIVSKSTKNLRKSVDNAIDIVNSIDLVKDLVNSPANYIDSEYLAKEAKRIAKENKYKIRVMGKRELTKLKAGGILAVNKGCDRDPKLIVLEYRGANSSKEKPVVLIGKGVIFDTGGYNLKPTGGMETMQQDMAGAATVLGVFNTLKKLGIKRNVYGIMPVVENLVNEEAYRPSDIITMLSGKTVEVTNTDAEGRMILADALYYGSELNPEFMLTIATLTGAVSVALGDRYCGLMGNNDDVVRKFIDAGNEVDELAWQLPIHNDYRKKMDSEVADFKNYDRGTGRRAGTAKAAAFLEKFVNKKDWVHVDIGGTAFTTDPKPYEQKGATAHGLRMILKMLEG
jgi:leucyl aminopeptidase